MSLYKTFVIQLVCIWNNVYTSCLQTMYITYSYTHCVHLSMTNCFAAIHNNSCNMEAHYQLVDGTLNVNTFQEVDIGTLCHARHTIIVYVPYVCMYVFMYNNVCI